MNWSMGLRAVGVGLGAAVALWGVLPLFTGRLHVGNAVLMLIGGLVVLICLRFDWIMRLWQHTAGKVALIACAIIAAAVLALFVIVSAKMIKANTHRPREDATVIVLGAGINGDRPSRILRERLDAAIEYLEAHPQAVCIVSGGQGPDEICSEAAVMQTYLLEHGIETERIYVEDRSENTAQNIEFSKRIIDENGLSKNVALVTQEFHQYRAQRYTMKSGFTSVGAITAHTPWDHLAGYWIRDFAGVCYMLFTQG